MNNAWYFIYLHYDIGSIHEILDISMMALDQCIEHDMILHRPYPHDDIRSMHQVVYIPIIATGQWIIYDMSYYDDDDIIILHRMNF